MLGFVLVGTVLGAAAAGGLLLAGGPLFLAFLVYSLVGAFVTLTAALLSFALSQPKGNEEIPFAGVLQPGE